jgi:NADH-quinone oxidoreductase subunit N
VSSPLSSGLQAAVVLAALVCLLLALDGPGARPRAEHHALLLAAVTGALVLAGARDLMTVVIALETSTLPVVGLVALRRDRVGAEAALKLLLVSVTSFGLLLLGVAVLYAATGSLHVGLMRAAVATGGVEPLPLALGIALVVAGVGYKLSAVPFGLWTPDVYAGSPVPVAALLSTVSKVAGLGAVLVVLTVALPLVADTWSPVVAVVAALSMTVGNLVALTQRTAVRLLAWSTVAQSGWVLLPLGGGLAAVLRPGADGGAGAGALGGVSGEAAPAAQAAVVYLLAYVVASLVAFCVVVLVTRHHVDGSAHDLDAYRGLARREPVAAGLLGLALLSLAGLPPGIAGLLGKVVAVGPVVDGEVWWLGVVAAVNVALGLAYYLRWTALLVAASPAAPATATATAAPGVPAAGATAVGASVLEAAGPAAGDAKGPAARAVTWDVRPAEGLALGLSGGLLVMACVLPNLLVGVAALDGVPLWP